MKIKGYENFRGKIKGYENLGGHLRGAKFSGEKMRGPKFFGAKIRGTKILVNLPKNAPTGYPGLKKTNPLLGEGAIAEYAPHRERLALGEWIFDLGIWLHF